MKYKIYATETCGYCRMAKNLLEQKGIEYEYLTMEAGSDIMMELKDWTKQQTVPIIFEVTDGVETFIGGFTELNKAINN